MGKLERNVGLSTKYICDASLLIMELLYLVSLGLKMWCSTSGCLCDRHASLLIKTSVWVMIWIVLGSLLPKSNLVNSDLDFPTGTQFSDKANYFPRAVRKFNHLCVACKHGHSAIALFAHIYVTRGHELIGYLIHEP